MELSNPDLNSSLHGSGADPMVSILKRGAFDLLYWKIKQRRRTSVQKETNCIVSLFTVLKMCDTHVRLIVKAKEILGNVEIIRLKFPVQLLSLVMKEYSFKSLSIYGMTYSHTKLNSFRGNVF